MANEFVARNGIKALQDSQITGSLNLTGNISASGFISASTIYADGSNLTNLPSAAINSYTFNAANEIITAVNSNGVEGEPNLTFDGSKLTVTGEVSASGDVSASAFWGDGSGLTGLDVAVTSYTNATDNRLVTSTGANGINAESNLTFDGSTLTVTGDLSVSGHITGSDIQLTGLTNQGSEQTALVINGTNNVGTRELGTAAFSNTGDFSSPAAVSGSFLEIIGDSVISASVEGDAQGQIKLNGVNVDTNALGTGDSPQFTNLTLTGDATINGDLTVLGDATQIQVSDLYIEDKQIVLASGSTTSISADGGGIFISGANASIAWDHTNQQFDFNFPISSSEITGSFSGDGSGLSGIATNLQEITDNGATTTNSTTFNGGVVVHGVQYTSGSQTGITGGTFTVSTIPTSSYTSAQWDYHVEDGTNYRAGTVIGIWDTARNAEYTDYSTADIGDTSGESFVVNTINSDARLQVIVGAGTWNVKAAVRAL